MTAILLYLAAGLLLIACLLLLFLNRDKETTGSREFWQPHDFWSDGSSMQVARQVFGSEDWEYIKGLNSKELERRFLKERTALALTWVEAARSEARALMRVHRTASSTSPHLNLHVELRITYFYAGLLFYCAVLEMVIRMRGPVALQRFVDLADSRSVHLYETVGQVFPFARPEAELEHAPGDMRP